jgi:thiol-disulfide isomerase/thioredoxin
VAEGFGGRARFVSENYGDSQLAKRFGVTRYPAIFVDDVLVATPNDFGFYGKGEGQEGGRYAPLRSAAAHERFRADLSRMIELTLAGHKDLARAQAAPSAAAAAGSAPAAADGAPARLPEVTIIGLDGRALTRDELAGRVVVVEFWATWCPPCRGTLGWLGDLKQRHGDRIAVVAVAVQSEEAAVRKLVDELKLPFAWSIGTADLARAFGDIGSVPTLFLFDRDGRGAGAFYGAPPNLHADAEAKIDRLLAP